MSMTGTLIAESLRTGTSLESTPLTTRKIFRMDSGDPSVGQPLTWTFIEFELADEKAEALAEELRDALDSGPWYCDFRSDEETVVVFAGRIFRYPRGDEAGRKEVEDYARSVGVPEPQVDWPR